MADLIHVTDATFDAEVLDSDSPVLVDFWADWCSPCKLVEPHLKAIATEQVGRVRVVKLNLDENPATANRYGVMSIPTMMLFRDGTEHARIVGAQPKASIMQQIEPHLGPTSANVGQTQPS
ncbi:MAG: thioredoxin [Actinomycetota bacterium]